MSIISGIVLAVRFILEIITVLGIFSGVFLSKTIPQKLLFLTLSLAITFVWARFGAPNSPHVLKGIYKFLLEIIVYFTGTIVFYSLFGEKIGTVYLVIVIIDLLLMYSLHLQGR